MSFINLFFVIILARKKYFIYDLAVQLILFD